MLFFYNFLIFFIVLLGDYQNVVGSRTIFDEERCGEVKQLCHNLSDNNDLLILECILATNPERLNKLQKPCQDIIWNHAHKLIEDQNVKAFLSPICGKELEENSCRVDNKGNYLKCLLDNIRIIRNEQCTTGIVRLESVAFTDYRWIASFLEHCTEDINRLKCGRLDGDGYSQTKTVQCLQDQILQVQDDCKREVFRLSEIQSNSIKLDAKLYVDCVEDHLRYCSHTTAGSGRIYPCLMRKFSDDPNLIGPKCRQQLLRREKLISQDFRISKGLLRACRDDIKKTHCRKQISSDKTVKLAQILLCLESSTKNGSKVDPECETEMYEHRRMLMESYSLSPEIVNDCKNETAIFCKGLEQGGKTIHCLMNHARNALSRVGDKCLRAVSTLLQVFDSSIMPE